MKYKSIRIADILTSEILFYDESYKDICFRFCDERNIDCLPAFDSSNKIYIKDVMAHDFRCEEIGASRKVNTSEFVFSSKLLEKFSENHLLVVYDNADLVGVVHFSDYAKPAVSVYLYEILFEYEKALRNLLERKGFTNDSMIEYFKQKFKNSTGKEKGHYQSKIRQYRKHRSDKEKQPPFQSFYLKDLLEFSIENDIVVNRDKVNDLRNSIMHAHDLVNKADPSAENLIYDFSSFKDFFEKARRLLVDYKRVNNLLSFTELDVSSPALSLPAHGVGAQ